MFSAFYARLHSPANIYSIDKYKDELSQDCWLIVTNRHIYTLKGSEESGVSAKLTSIPNPQSIL